MKQNTICSEIELAALALDTARNHFANAGPDFIEVAALELTTAEARLNALFKQARKNNVKGSLTVRYDEKGA